MTTPRSLRASLLLAGTAAFAAWVSMFAWNGFTEADERHLGPLLVLGAVIAVTGAVTRWWRWPRPLVVLAQVGISGGCFLWLFTGQPLPTEAVRAEVADQFRGAVESARLFAAPVPADVPDLAPLLVLCGLAVMLLVDLLAGTLRRPPLAGLPLLTVYSVPLSVLGGGVSATVFAVSSAAFLLLLFVHGSDRISGWGRPIAGARDASDLGDPGPPARSGAAGPTALAVGAGATALAVAVPALVPTLDLDLLGIGPGEGRGGEVKIENPTADLLRDLNRGDDIPLVRVTTDQPRPSYLRVSTLNRFTGQEWTPGNRDIPASNRPGAELPPLQGVSPDVPRREFDYRVQIADSFRSAWLPTQFPLAAIDADGDWRYDERTMDFFRWDEELDTRGMDYRMSAVRLELDGAALSVAGSSTADVDEQFLELPDDLPGLVERLSRRVTADAPTRFEKAVALQQWFRTEFDYSLESSPVEGSGFDALVQFLTPGDQGRVGYCEQFAAAMAAMARVLGIPARVAIGFLAPDRVGPRMWEYSAHDLHAWPELYFDGFGWVRFEPTPGTRAPRVPGYTRQPDGIGRDTERPSPGSDGAEGTQDPRLEEPRLPPEQESAADDTGAATGSGGRGLLVAGGLLMLAVGLGAVPRWARRRLRERRLDGGPETAWAELRDTAVDQRAGWPDGRSPREARDHLVERFGTPGLDGADQAHPPRGVGINPTAEQALDRIVADLELQRYSRAHQPAYPSLRAELQCCLEALEAGATARDARRARWWPVSLLSPTRRRGVVAEEQTDQAGDLIGQA